MTTRSMARKFPRGACLFCTHLFVLGEKAAGMSRQEALQEAAS
jgi:hypothetical protein